MYQRQLNLKENVLIYLVTNLCINYGGYILCPTYMTVEGTIRCLF